jgi:hypothetical protein
MNIRALMTFLFASFVLAIFIVLGFHTEQNGSAPFLTSYFTGLSNWWSKMTQVDTTSNTVVAVSPVTLPVSSAVSPKVIKSNDNTVNSGNNSSAMVVKQAKNDVAKTLSDNAITLPPGNNAGTNDNSTSKVLADSGAGLPDMTQNHNKSGATPVCMSYGPLNLEQKALFDVVLKKASLNNLPVVSQRPLYQIYWDLGKDKEQAITLFEKQKNGGPLQDVRFKLTQQESGEWIVPIATISGNAQMAQTISNQLDAKAHAGGKWLSQPMGDGYFYRFKDLNLVPEDSLNLLDKAVNVTKSPC